MFKILILLLLLLVLIFLVFLVLKILEYFKIKKELEKNIKKNKLKNGSRYIPKNIYQTVPDKNNIDQDFLDNIGYIKKLNPNWTHTIYDNSDIIKYIKKNYSPYILDIYNKINPEYGAARADFFRYLLMYNEGGVYLDIKSSMQIPLDVIIQEDDEYILSHWKIYENKKIIGNCYGEYQQWYIICRPKHPFLQSTIKNVINNIENYDIDRDGIGKPAVLKITGPIVYTKSILPLLSQYKHKLYRRHEYIGLKYTIYGSYTKHYNKVDKKHYSKLKTPIIIK